MAQDEHFVSNSNNSGGSGGAAGGTGGAGGNGLSNNRSKNTKQKKVPQRGLGVAQLERIRLEEQRNREALQAANALANNAIGSGDGPAQCPNFAPNPIPIPPSPPSFNNAFYRSVPLGTGKHLNEGDGEEVGGSSWPRLWAGEQNLDGSDKPRVDQHVGFTFGQQVNVHYESNGPPVFPLPGSYPFQRPRSAVVNGSTGIPPSSLSSSQIEPPSIQSVHGSNYSTPSWTEDDKIVGLKRSYPFSLETPPGTPSFLSNFHPSFVASRSRSDELPSCSSEPRNKYIRDGPSNSTPSLELNPSEDVNQIGDFLTLAPPGPVASPPSLNSKNKHPLDYLGHQGLDLSDHRSLSSQENFKSSLAHHPGPSASKEQQPFSFFPIKSHTEQTSLHARNGNGEKEEKLDLNLKL